MNQLTSNNSTSLIAKFISKRFPSDSPLQSLQIQILLLKNFGNKTIFDLSETKISNLNFHDLTRYGISSKYGDSVRRLLGLNTKFAMTPNHSIQSREVIEATSRTMSNLSWQILFSKPGEDRPKFVPNPLKISTGRIFPQQPDPTTGKFDIPQHLVNLIEEVKTNATLLSQFNGNYRKLNLTKEQHTLLRTLKADSDIKITCADKNLGLVVLDKQDYIDGCLKLLNDSTTYQPMTELEASSCRTQTLTDISILVKQLKIAKFEHPDFILNNLETSSFGTFYGIPKIHKLDQNGKWNKSYRPIVSCISAPTYNLSKYIDTFLSKYVQSTHSYLKHSDALLSMLSKIDPANVEMRTYDATNLYSNIPIMDAINCIDFWLQKPDINGIILSIKQRLLLLNACKIVLWRNDFKFANLNFRQKIGIAMGTPMAVNIACLFLARYEHESLFISNNASLLLYRRFIDDVIAIFIKSPGLTPSVSDSFFDNLNKLAPNIKWTRDASQTGSAAVFLDLAISIDVHNKWVTRTNEKLLNCYSYVAGTSCHPESTVKGILTGLVGKYFKQHSNESDFTEICKRLLYRLHVRGYSKHLLQHIFERIQTLRKDKALKTSSMSNNEIAKPPIIDSTQTNYIILTYDKFGFNKKILANALGLPALNNGLAPYKLNISISYRNPTTIGKVILKSKEDNNTIL